MRNGAEGVRMQRKQQIVAQEEEKLREGPREGRWVAGVSAWCLLLKRFFPSPQSGPSAVKHSLALALFRGLP